MPKNRLSAQVAIDSGPSQSTNMDEYICPTCETECTCSRPKLPVLKIKLTVPPASSKESGLTRAPVPPVKRKRGRPPKVVMPGTVPTPPVTQNQPKRRPGRPRKNPLPVAPSSSTTVTPPPDINAESSVLSDDGFPTFISASALSASNSSASEAGMSSDSADDLDDDVDPEIEKEEEKFIRKEQRERGKRDKKVERARVKRQQQQHKTSRKDSGRQYQQQQARRESNTGRHDLFHSDEDGSSNPHTEWIIRTRRPSDADVRMLGIDFDLSSSTSSDSSSSEDEDSDDDEDDGDEADEEPDAVAEVDDDEDDGPRYSGLATGWSDSEESSFDADLFFANLSDSHSSQEGSDSDRDEIASEHGCPDHTDPPIELGSQMELEVTGDGQLIFSTGLPTFGFGSSLLDFETHHQPYLTSFEPMTPPPSQTQSIVADDDVEMQPSPRAEDDQHRITDEEDEEEELDGNTTDEDLVGPDQLPNAKALRIFKLPDSHPPSLDAPFPFTCNGLSGVNPLSTVSPAGSPAPGRSVRRRRKSSLLHPSPAPSDILSGNFRRLDVYGEDDDEDVSMESSSDTTRGRKRVKATVSTGPVALPFLLPETQETPFGEIFVVDDERKPAPSPYHKKALRLRKRRLRFGGLLRHKSGISHDGISPLFFKDSSPYQPARHSSMPPPTRTFSLDQDLTSSVGSLPDLDPGSAASTSDTADTSPIQSVDQIALDEVLDPSFMDDEGTWSDQSTATNDGSTLSHFRRWDLISVGAFRRTRESALSSDDWGSDTATKDYGSVLRSSPMNVMLWSNRLGSSSAAGRSRVSVSPLLSPLKDDEGEKTPTTLSLSPPSSNASKSPLHARKESRQERKPRRKHALHNHYSHHSPSKNGGGTLHQHHHHHTHHHHHPNSKTRSAGSSQRSSFFSQGSTSPTSQ